MVWQTIIEPIVTGIFLCHMASLDHSEFLMKFMIILLPQAHFTNMD